jgi:hypothetical protein
LATNLVSTTHAQYKIPLTADAGYIEFYSANPPSAQFFDMNEPRISQLSISLVDRNGFDVSLNGNEWSMLLRIDHD